MIANCPECGHDIPRDAGTMGLCPRCLMDRVVRTAFSSRTLSPGLLFTPPSVQELQQQLPQIEIIELIGQGGMGAVYRARQRGLDRAVALKIFPRESEDPAFAQRFAREARVLASLNHPNIVIAHEFGQSSGYSYLVMELVEGQTLRQALQTNRPPAAESIRIVRQVCDALEYAHQRGVVHRDIKPENILIEPTGRVRVADFGLAKLIEPEAADFSLTLPEQRLGTPYYVAPEQRDRDNSVDARADIYSLGVILYEMLTGELPIGHFPPASRLAPGVDRRLDAIVTKCLQSDPKRRYATAAEVSACLDRLSRSRHSPWLIRSSFAAAAVLVIAVVIWRVLPKAKSPDTTASTDATPQLSLSKPPVGVDSPQTKREPPATAPAINVQQMQPDRDPNGALKPPEVYVRANPRPFWMPPRPDLRPPNWDFPRPPIGPRSAQEWTAQMIAQHGADRVVTIQIDGLAGDVRQFIHERLSKLTGGASYSSSGSNQSLTIQMAPIADIQALADKIDFGTVRSVDKEKRIIRIDVDATKLPNVPAHK